MIIDNKETIYDAPSEPDVSAAHAVINDGHNINWASLWDVSFSLWRGVLEKASKQGS